MSNTPSIIDAAEALLRMHLDAAEVHPCDRHKDAIRAQQCVPEVQALYAALNGVSNVKDPMDMALCEASSLVLRVGQAYTFRPVGDCAKCASMAQQALEAYGEGFGLDLTPVARDLHVLKRDRQ